MGLQDRRQATTLAHYGYGTAMGAIYGVVQRHVRMRSVPAGIAFGLGVWAVSYLGWLPTFGWRASAGRQSVRRNLMMIAAHIVWGAVLGASRSGQNSDGRVR
jgi:uncharacterized membrane protein YagU involved in acid resistance